MSSIHDWPGTSAALAYDSLAPAYDVLTALYCHDAWLEEIVRLATLHGLEGQRLLDIACGTGKSFLPLYQRGYDVTACDLSARMVEIARDKAPHANVMVGDMRTLAALGSFDLVTCLDDAVNYLLTARELEAFFRGVARNLAAHGVAVFDVNSLRAYREDFHREWLVDDPAAFIAWTAAPPAEVAAGTRIAATIHVFSPDGDKWVRSASRHEQRHWPGPDITAAAAKAALRIAAVYGQHRGAKLEASFDELAHNKALYLVTHERKAVNEMRIMGP